MITAKTLTKSTIDRIIDNSIENLKIIKPSIDEENTEKIRTAFLSEFEKYVDNVFWYQEPLILIVKIIDYIEQKLGISLESVTYDGAAEKWLKFFAQLTYPYNESP